MRLTKAECRILNQLAMVEGGSLRIDWLMPSPRRVARQMRDKGLLSKRAWLKGSIVATAKGHNSHKYSARKD